MYIYMSFRHFYQSYRLWVGSISHGHGTRCALTIYTWRFHSIHRGLKPQLPIYIYLHIWFPAILYWVASKKQPPLNILFSNGPAWWRLALLVGGGAISALGGFQLLNGLLFINDAVAWNSGGAQDSKPRGWTRLYLKRTASKSTWTYGWFGIYGICICFQNLGWPVF